MKIKIFLTLLTVICLISSCKQCDKTETLIPDTIYIEKIDSVAINVLRDSVKYYRDSAWRETDYLNAKRCAKIKYYISICEKNNSQKKFFYGWVKRTMAE